MMEKMSEVESGNFDIQLPVESRDEIGILSERFNQMSSALKAYINQSYVAAIKQTEAELTALKSQIYPHFLYNTLEIIRMTALENEDVRVSEMIEALSQQIHYLIGPVQDMVSLEKELGYCPEICLSAELPDQGKGPFYRGFKGLSGEAVRSQADSAAYCGECVCPWHQTEGGSGHVMRRRRRTGSMGGNHGPE